MYDILTGLSLVEVSSFVASPTAGLYMAQFGADVIRVDQIGGGQDFHRWPVTRQNDSLSWENLNRAKRSLALDLTRPEGRDLLVELTRKVGNLVTNLPAKGFLAHDRLAEGRPDLVTVRIMGWPDGSVALDYTANAAVGYTALTGPVEDPRPVNHVLPAWDLLTGAYAAFAMLAAVRRRELTGEGGEVRLPLTDIAIGSAANLGRVAEVLYTGRDRERLGNAVFGTIGRDFVTRDGVRFMLVAINERQWQGLVKALGIADAIAAIEIERGVTFADDDGARFAHRDAIFAAIEHEVAQYDHADLATLFDVNGVVHGPYRTMMEAVEDPRLVTENPVFAITADNPSGFAYPAAGAFATLPGLERMVPAPAPRNGQHSEAILADVMGLSSGEIGKLIDQGIAGTDL
ncbi:2-methylfumaryl-CoA isomerase [Novosphingobium kunmingense]|uniref:2-methylfumaryl-CoA isomerase n=1 Tax=Novosphingobium kunmingense TaxID=1211806 RepID=A0A2N0H7D9_9SPHN|nr:CoA transferase [Novosphingobium kunmingense]PKB14862.1 2-methylfumaryl-CoA isomerase [Novosphingobium kunmingense]